jgi:hypothetical protein
MKTIFCLMLIGATIPALAQWRVVNGQYYRADDPRVWRVFPDLQAVEIFPDGALQVREVFQQYSTSGAVGIKQGLYGTQTASYETYGQTFVLLHYRSNIALAPGMNIGCVKAMLVPPATVSSGERNVTTADANYAGSAGYGSASARVADSAEYDAVTYDVGVPYYPPAVQLTAAQIAAKKAVTDSNVVVFVRSTATNGDVASQCELGERYMRGDGVPQDKKTGQMWLERAELGGSIEASNDLQAFTLTNNVTVK